MRLVIAEKPSVAKSLAAVLGAATRKDGYLEGNGWLVSWCLGHLAGLADAATYNPSGAMTICPFCRSPGASPSPRTNEISLTCCAPCCGGRT